MVEEDDIKMTLMNVERMLALPFRNVRIVPPMLMFLGV